MRKISLFILLVLLIIPAKILAEDLYPAGSLLALNQPDATVYYIGEDGKKYIFPDSKTYFTWYDNFNNVIKVDVIDLDKYSDGGVMPYKPGIKLIKHINTANVYAVEPNGILRRIPSEAVAQQLYGDDWSSMVQDVIPGYFSSSYTVGSDLNNLYPTGTLIKEARTGYIYYVDGKYKRPFYDTEALTINGFDQDKAIVVDNFDDYEFGRTINDEEDILKDFLKDKFASRVLSYKIVTTAGCWSQVYFIDENFTPIEVRRMVVSGSNPQNVGYDDNRYAFDYYDDFPDNFYDYDQESITVSSTSTPLTFSPRDSCNPFGGGTSSLKPELKYWEIWDVNENKPIVNLRNQYAGD